MHATVYNIRWHCVFSMHVRTDKDWRHELGWIWVDKGTLCGTNGDGKWILVLVIVHGHSRQFRTFPECTGGFLLSSNTN